MLHNQHDNYLNHARLGVQSSFERNVGANNNQQNMLGSYANQPYYAKSYYNNVGGVFSSNGTMGHGLMTSANGLRRGVNHGDNQLMYPNYGSLENNHKFTYGQANWNMGSLNNSNNNLQVEPLTLTTAR